MLKILKEKNNIYCIKVKDRSKTQTKRIAQFNYKLRKHPEIVHMLLNKFPQLKIKRGQMTAA